MAPPLIVFSIPARQRLRQRTTRAAATHRNALVQTMQNIGRQLERVFPNDNVAIVQDLYSGYRARDEEYILLVEIAHSGANDGMSVVKLGPADRLQRELEGWALCRPTGLRHDLVLTVLEPRLDSNNELIAIVYADAEQFIGVDQTLSLEAALLASTRLGVPTPESVADVLFNLYERLGLILYRNAYTDDPTTPEVPFSPERLDEHLMDNLGVYQGETGSAHPIRQIATAVAHEAGLSQQFLDPCDFAEYTRCNSTTHMPRLRRGHAHGDLHGRNVLVGRIVDRVLWPAVFDYADMGTDNLIGREFVKMETEFKLRAYPELFPGPQPGFITQVIRVEHEIHQMTEACRNANEWPHAPAGATALDRFRFLVLMIRKEAGQQLGSLCNRTREWLAEYYYLLAIYGLNSGRFDNQTELQQLGGYLSAGCAASRFEPK